MHAHLSPNLLFYGTYVVLAVFFFFFSSPLLQHKQRRRRLKVNLKRNHAYLIFSVQLWFWLAFAVAYHVSDLYLPAQSPLAVFANLPTLPLSLFFPTWFLTVVILMAGDRLIDLLRHLFAWNVMFSRDLTEALETGAIIAGLTSMLYAQCDPNSGLAFSYSSFELSHDHDSYICQWIQTGTAEYRNRVHPMIAVWLTVVSLSFVNFVFESFERFEGVRGVFASNLSREDMTRQKLARATQDDSSNVLSAEIEQIVDSPGQEMVNWYSLVQTEMIWGLLISFKVFLGRFDTRELQSSLQHYHNGHVRPIESSKPAARFESPPPPASRTLLQQLASASEPADWSDDEPCRDEPSLIAQAAAEAAQVASVRAREAAKLTLNDEASVSARWRSLGVHDHLANRSELFFDFMADCGDGWNSSYAIARALSQPTLPVKLQSNRSLPDSLFADLLRRSSSVTKQHRSRLKAIAAAARKLVAAPLNSMFSPIRSVLLSTSSNDDNSDTEGSSSDGQFTIEDDKDAVLELPRGETLILGGDLAYPTPSLEEYDNRFFAPFEAAMKSHADFRPDSLSFDKFRRMKGLEAPQETAYLRTLHSVYHSTYESEFVRIMQQLRNKHGLSSKFDVKAPAAPPIVDSLGSDAHLKPPTCFAIPGNHDWFDGLQTFIRRICYRDQLGGWQLPQSNSYFALRLPRGWWVFGLDKGLAVDIDARQYAYFARICDAMPKTDRVILVTHEPQWVLDPFEGHSTEFNIQCLIRDHIQSRLVLRLAGDLHHYTRHSPAPSQSSLGLVRSISQPLLNGQNNATSPDSRPEPIGPTKSLPPFKLPASSTTNAAEKSATGGGSSLPSSASLPSLRLPTSMDDFDISDSGVTGSAHCPSTPKVATTPLLKSNRYGPLSPIAGATKSNSLSHISQFSISGSQQQPQPQAPPLPHMIVSGGGGAFLMPTHSPDPPVSVSGVPYRRVVAYPPPSLTRTHAWLNVFGFRRRNWRFDALGGFVYYLLVCSMMPLCMSWLEPLVQTYTKYHPNTIDWWELTWAEVVPRALIWIGFFFRCALEWLLIVGRMHLYVIEESVWLMVFILVLWLVLVGLVPEHKKWWQRVAIGTGHTICHTIAAFSVLLMLMLLIELGQRLGVLGHAQLSHWLRFQQSFPVIAEWFSFVDDASSGLLTWFMKLCMTVFDVPENLAYFRQLSCSGTVLSRLHTIFFHFNFLLCLWILATPLVSFIFGSYLTLSVNVFDMHHTEAFSSLQGQDYKNFLRLHVTETGELEIFAIGIDRVAREWAIDPRWTGLELERQKRKNEVGHNSTVPEWSHMWSHPSKYKAASNQPDELVLIDYIVLPAPPRE